MPEDDTVISRAYTGKTCRVARNAYTNDWEQRPQDLQPFPQQFLTSMNDGANHLGLGLDEGDVDPDREFYPVGQGVGAIHELIPAGEIVRNVMNEAEVTLSALP